MLLYQEEHPAFLHTHIYILDCSLDLRTLWTIHNEAKQAYQKDGSFNNHEPMAHPISSFYKIPTTTAYTWSRTYAQYIENRDSGDYLNYKTFFQKY